MDHKPPDSFYWPVLLVTDCGILILWGGGIPWGHASHKMMNIGYTGKRMEQGDRGIQNSQALLIFECLSQF